MNRVITTRQKEVLHWMARGKNNAEIAAIVGLRLCTVKNHVCHILAIYGSTNRICAVMRALARGDVSRDDLFKEFA